MNFGYVTENGVNSNENPIAKDNFPRILVRNCEALSSYTYFIFTVTTHFATTPEPSNA